MKYQPVRIMTVIVAVLTALLGVGDLTSILPATVVGAAVTGVAVLTAILGALTRARVTPLARPRDAVGTPLVPATRGSVIRDNR